MCHEKNPDWVHLLPTVLLGLCCTYQGDPGASCAEMLHGTALTLPGKIFVDDKTHSGSQTFANLIREQIRELRPKQILHRNKRSQFIFKEFKSCSHIFLCLDTLKISLYQPYSGPNRVVDGLPPSVFTIETNGKCINVSMERLKPPFLPTYICGRSQILLLAKDVSLKSKSLLP